MGPGNRVAITCSCSSLIDIKVCPFKLQVAAVVVGQNVAGFVVFTLMISIQYFFAKSA